MPPCEIIVEYADKTLLRIVTLFCSDETRNRQILGEWGVAKT
jgi:hypothetical protein